VSLTTTCRRIKLILSDVDGVMTDGAVTFGSGGLELKTFNIRDGLGVKLWQRSGGLFGIVTGRRSEIVERRAAELKVAILRQGIDDKLPVVNEIAAECGVSLAEIAYIGDDLPDLPVVRAVGLGVTVNDGAEELRQAAAYITSQPGGRGAVRELVEVILKNSDRWDETVLQF